MSFSDYTVREISAICQGTLYASPGEDFSIRDLLIDSRRLIHPGHTLFIALVTDRNDGHRYIADLYEKGVRCFLVSRLPEEETPISKAAFILVKDTLTALQKLAAFHRNRFPVPVVGITGSNGKTIVKEWLFQLLSPRFRIIRSPKSYNSQIGVALSLWKMNPDHTLALFEAGISLPGEMEKLAGMIRPDIGIFTNIGAAHDEHFENRRHKTTEKLKLFRGSKVLVYCADNELITECLKADPVYRDLRTFTWSRNTQADLTITAVEKKDENCSITARHKSGTVKIKIPFTDDASIENAITCLGLLFSLRQEGYLDGDQPGPDAVATGQKDALLKGFSVLTPVAMRLELKEAINHCSLINDSYNSDINSLGIALNFLDQQNQHRKRTVILSDILQTGRDKETLYREINALLEAQHVTKIIGIGRDLVKHAERFTMQKFFYLTTDEFLHHFPFSSLQNEAILLKGARLFEFEKISQVLQMKAHETVLEVNLDALIHNLNHYRSLLQPGTRTMAMVKAFSYGSGSYEIANVLQFHRVDYLTVAYGDEGVELRKAGIRLPIMVMSPEEESLDVLLKYNLEPEIYNLRILDLLEEAMIRNQTAIQEAVRIHIKLDSGMHRLGFQEKELELLIDRLKMNPALHVQSVFSHLAASEDPAEDAFTRQQISLFDAMSQRILSHFDYPILRHILNSAGTSRFPEARFDMVRLGIGLYGIGCNQDEQSKLRNVSTLRTAIIQIKHIPAGDTIGYNRKGKADKDKVIAVLPVGYADGLNRRLGNGKGKVFIHGKPAPVIGNICMDLTMVDITEMQETTGPFLREGTEVIIFNDDHPVTELAEAIGTIPYEVLTSLSRRVKRIYFNEQ